MNKKISLSFAVDADSVSLKSICKKDFLELQMRAISTANPNLNGSWFTKEALLDAVDSCKNKPILGYFNAEGDFESHNGVWRKDVETGLEYWDTSNGEQMLGMIRESDEVKVVDADDGLSWLCLSCALWTQYNFKQVKRLFKDAKKAKENGGVTKNISVEIDIIEGEKQENGIYRIDKFNLLGITILGSRNGKQVQPGIANAALSIPEIIGTDFYAKQERALRVAYSRLDNTDSDDVEEDILQMEKNELNTPVDTPTATDPIVENPTVEAGVNPVEPTTNFAEGEVCPDCGKNPCECASKKEGKANEDCHEGEHNAAENGTAGDGNVDNVDPEGGEGSMQCSEPEGDPKEEVRDVAWLVNHISYGYEVLNDTINYYEFLIENHPDVAPHGAYIVSVLKRCLHYEQRIEGTLGGLLAKIAGEITEADEQYEAKLVSYENTEELIANYEDAVSKYDTLSQEKDNIVKENDTLKADLRKYTQAEFLNNVNALIASAGLEEKVGKEIYEACENGSISTYEDAKVKVAVAAFDAKKLNNIPQVDPVEAPTVVAPVDTPNTHAAFEGEAEKPSRRSSWDVLHNYISK